MDDTAKMIVALLILAFIAFVIIFGPIFTIWSINCLFGTEILLNFKTWCAMTWLLVILGGIRLGINKE
jgi:hypothetical protein